ncbi:hypothetical protein FDK12_14310 [Arthrobacter sp. NamB2]|uniref:hypothetical protein n=1 Tax=Arthrobacter sp. NamB2 TaxID=2576035 RepID=UPI0010C9E7D9|nr:hypothetical protein [Arthrobacter sp. NamB2]TKV26130.1 hypothetical protein FDK12_14310 [Arthrobacter sp. NamB2]
MTHLSRPNIEQDPSFAPDAHDDAPDLFTAVIPVTAAPSMKRERDTQRMDEALAVTSPATASLQDLRA